MDSSVIFSLFSVIELPRTAFYHVSQISWFKFADLQIYGKIKNAYIPHMLIARYMIWRFHLFATVQIRWQFHYAVLQSLVSMPQQFLDMRWQDSCHTMCNKSAKGAYTWSSPVYLSMCEGSEYTSLSENYSKCNNFKAVGIG